MEELKFSIFIEVLTNMNFPLEEKEVHRLLELQDDAVVNDSIRKLYDYQNSQLTGGLFKCTVFLICMMILSLYFFFTEAIFIIFVLILINFVMTAYIYEKDYQKRNRIIRMIKRRI